MEKKRYKIGAAVIATELNVPIIPIAHNAGKFWKKNAFIKTRNNYRKNWE